MSREGRGGRAGIRAVGRDGILGRDGGIRGMGGIRAVGGTASEKVLGQTNPVREQPRTTCARKAHPHTLKEQFPCAPTE